MRETNRFDEWRRKPTVKFTRVVAFYAILLPPAVFAFGCSNPNANAPPNKGPGFSEQVSVSFSDGTSVARGRVGETREVTGNRQSGPWVDANGETMNAGLTTIDWPRAIPRCDPADSVSFTASAEGLDVAIKHAGNLTIWIEYQGLRSNDLLIDAAE